MVIQKDGNMYSITELNSKWIVKAEEGKVSIACEISKDICSTIDELKKYIQENDLF